ncbi:GGDEF domain-containing protein [Actinoplanes sp. NPDC051861]|uniref:GGDEF domain-containing protein n=1 Tax=Actinoplanes sp. NPDC051861 TaxID=3155170 RepID=UPI003437A748
MSDHSLAAQHLVELLAVVSSCDDEESAIRAAVERAAETLQAEICGLVVDDTVLTAVGLPEGSPDYRLLAGVRSGRGSLTIPGVGVCETGAAVLGSPGEGSLVLARIDEPFTVAEHNLIRGMARVLGLTLRMLRTLHAQRRQERLMRHLYEIQRSLSRRAPLAEVLRTTLAATRDIVAGPHGTVELRLTGTEVGGQEWPMRPATGDDPVAIVVRTSAAFDHTDESGRAVISVPVHEHGRTVGALTVTTGNRLDDSVLSFAEHISLALTDARTALDMEAARRDGLTGLAGRALFHERLQDYLTESRAGEVALLFVDLDRFKQVNDTLGHDAGDLLLLEVARRLQAVVRSTDMAGRLGGDEFAVVLSPTGERHASTVATRIIDEVSRPYRMPDGRLATIGASVGIALNTDDDEHDLIRRADVAMYRAKRSGRGRSVLFRDLLAA